MMMDIEQHPLEPFLPANAKILMLGSFPPQKKRWSTDFYYPNIQNDMWRIFGLLFFNDKEHFLTPDKKAFHKEDIIAFLKIKGVAIYDSATAVRRLQDNASDKFLEVVTPTSISMLLDKLPICQAIVTTGEKATELVIEQFGINKPKIGEFSEFLHKGKTYRLYRMPSSSRAYPLALDKKASVYSSMFSQLNML